uniref:EGF-like domain-containing protein n=1 Tax=Heterorhabditis bacteriophora TaxID=37862 RepID=A0A1I7X7M8_HETBA
MLISSCGRDDGERLLDCEFYIGCDSVAIDRCETSKLLDEKIAFKNISDNNYFAEIKHEKPNKRVINDNGVLECEQCVCPNGTRYSGYSCAIASDPCQTKPCDNDPNSRTACYATESGYECRCPVGQAGPKCQFNRAAKLCWPDPCSSRGTCQENLSDKTYVCKCNDNFFGSQCQYERKECDITCQNGGKCRQDAKFDMFLCDCQNGFHGQLCDTKDTGKVEFGIIISTEYFFPSFLLSNTKDNQSSVLSSF